MAQTRGLVQRIKVEPSPPGNLDICWVYIGPSPTNTTLFAIGLLDTGPGSHLRRSIGEAITGALFARREVIITHPQNSWAITALEVVPG
jgi:hypothetical protein